MMTKLKISNEIYNDNDDNCTDFRLRQLKYYLPSGGSSIVEIVGCSKNPLFVDFA